MKISILLSALVLLLLLPGCGPGIYDNVQAPTSGAVAVAPDGAPAAQLKKPTGVLSPGDLIRLTFPGAQQFNQKQKIRRNNRVSLPMVGDVIAGGKELKAFQKELVQRYASHLQNPNVVVTVEKTAATVYVSGYVEKPSKITLDRPMTALEAIMEAGGFNKYGSPKRVSVVRNENGVYRRYRLNLDAALQGLARPFPLRPNDVIHVR